MSHKLRLSAARDVRTQPMFFEQDVHEDYRMAVVFRTDEWFAADRFYLYYPGRAHMAPKLRVFIGLFLS